MSDESIFSLDDLGLTQEVVRTAPIQGKPESKIWLVFPAVDMKAAEKENIFKTTYGYCLEDTILKSGINPNSLYCVSVLREPLENYELVRHIKLPESEVLRFAELVQQYKPDLIILVGQACLKAFTGEQALDDWRGSFLHSEVLNTLTLPIYEQCRLFLEPAMKFVTQIDLKKIKTRLAPEWEEPVRNYIIEPTLKQTLDYLDALKVPETIFSLDIETRYNELACIGFSTEPYEAFVIPFYDKRADSERYWTVEEEEVIFIFLAEVLQNPTTTKVLQNAIFDQTFLYDRYQILSAGPTYDTMVISNLLYPDFPKSLGFLTSIYTLDPYYKDEGAAWKNPKILEEQFWAYNAKDADTTLRIFNIQMRRAEKEPLHRDKIQELSNLYPHIFHMGLRGLPVDLEKKEELTAGTHKTLLELEELVEELAAAPLNPGSAKQMQEYFYKLHGLPVQKDRKTKQPTTDSGALEDLRRHLKNLKLSARDIAAGRNEWRLNQITLLETILEYKKIEKLRSSYFEIPVSADGQLRSMFNIAGTETGRFSASKFFDGTGCGLQTLPKKAKAYIHIPKDSDEIFVNLDLAQAEARVVAYISGDEGLIDLFLSGVDYHTKNAMNVWGYDSLASVPAEKRQLVKKGGHGCNYGMMPFLLAKEMDVPLAEAKAFRAAYMGAYPRIPQWHIWTQTQLIRNRYLITPLGRKRIFLGDVASENTLKEALAHVPQSTVPEYLNQGLVRYEQLGYPDTRLLLQCHDSLLFRVRRSFVDEFITIIRACIEVPITCLSSNHDGISRDFIIPCDFEVGSCYGKMIRYSTISQEKEVLKLLAAGVTQPEIVANLTLNKDAVSAIASDNTWR